MNVCFLLAGFAKPGGIERVVSIIVNHLCCDKNIAVFCLCYTNKIDESLYQIDTRIHCDYLFEDSPSMTSAFFRRSIIKKVKKYIKDNTIDIIIGCGVLYYPLSVISAKLTGIKSICWEHTNPTVNCDYRFQKQCRQFGLLFSDANVVLSQKAISYYNQKRKKNILLIIIEIQIVMRIMIMKKRMKTLQCQGKIGLYSEKD